MYKLYIDMCKFEYKCRLGSVCICIGTSSDCIINYNVSKNLSPTYSNRVITLDLPRLNKYNMFG